MCESDGCSNSEMNLQQMVHIIGDHGIKLIEVKIVAKYCSKLKRN